MRDLLTLRPIGVIRTPFMDRVSAPRQTYLAKETPGTIVLDPGRDFEDALSDLAGWEYAWVLYWFHLNEGWRPKVLPPRSKVRRGVFATRSPHRPNPIGMSVVRLVRVEGLNVQVRGVDMVDGSPVLDLKPYVAAADAIPDAHAGWLASSDPIAPYEVVWSSLAAAQVAWLKEVHAVDLADVIERALALGPEPHAYRRIRKEPSGSGSVLAVKDWRARFELDGDTAARRMRVVALRSGYRETQLKDAALEGIEVHRAFCAQGWEE